MSKKARLKELEKMQQLSFNRTTRALNKTSTLTLIVTVLAIVQVTMAVLMAAILIWKGLL